MCRVEVVLVLVLVLVVEAAGGSQLPVWVSLPWLPPSHMTYARCSLQASNAESYSVLRPQTLARPGLSFNATDGVLCWNAVYVYMQSTGLAL